jgi:hypothetical protein
VITCMEAGRGKQILYAKLSDRERSFLHCSQWWLFDKGLSLTNAYISRINRPT